MIIKMSSFVQVTPKELVSSQRDTIARKKGKIFYSAKGTKGK